jgi:uncharacterized membrane protein
MKIGIIGSTQFTEKMIEARDKLIKHAYDGLLKITFVAVFLFGSFSIFSDVHAQELVKDTQSISKAEILEILKQETRNIPGLDTKTEYQTLRVKILEGEEKGKEITLENDYQHLRVGEIFYLLHTTNSVDGRDQYAVSELYRLPALYFFIGLFILCVLIFGGWQGIRALASLIGSLLFIMYVLLPAILHGYSPILVSIGVSSIIILIGSYITHGFNKTTTAAVLGMIVTIVFTGLLAYAAVKYTRLSGFESEESVYLNFDTGGSIDFSGLLLGGIMIGVLGILYDVAIGQAISVEELRRAGPHLPKTTIYKRAIRMGREHIGALVNTLAIAYVGASLPLLLLFYSSKADFSWTLNKEIFSTEIIRTMIGSIGLILAVPISTLFAVWILSRHERGIQDKATLHKEQEAIEHINSHI